MEMVSEEEWEGGEVIGGNEERRKKIMKVLEGNKGYSRKRISEKSGIKWVYSEIMKMCKEGILERKKFGKKFMYRVSRK